MKNIAFIIFTVFISANNIFSQKEEWIVKDGDEVRGSVPDSIEYLYPQFITGLVYFKDGKISRAQLNYNLLIEEMQFINGNDTLAIANEKTIKLITINNDSFYYDKTYLHVVTGTTSVKLAKREVLKIGDVQKMSAYDQPTSTSATTTINTLYNTSGRAIKLDARENLVLLKQTSYYIGDTYDHFLPATKKNVIKMFGHKQNEVEIFLNENKISFNKEDDLKKLIAFLQSI